MLWKFVIGGSTVVEHSPWHHKVKSLSPATDTGTERESDKKYNAAVQIHFHIKLE